jgi:hypothetical protein
MTMSTPFPGMDPYLEHPVLWEGVHARLIVAMANQLQPKLDPRYIASIEERVFIEGPQRRIPDIWVQRMQEEESPVAVAELEADPAIVLEVEELEVHQKRIEIVDLYNEMKLVTVIELVSPTNKAPGPGRESYIAKQQELLSGDCHLVEIDLHREGQHAVSVPEWLAEQCQPYDYLVCVNRWPHRSQYRVNPRRLRQRLPKILIPLVEPDPDIVLDIQSALERVYVEGRYARRVRYGEACVPALAAEDQAWATQRAQAFENTEPAAE